MKRLGVIALSICLLIIIAFSLYYFVFQKKSLQPLPQVRLGVEASVLTVPVWVAKEKGCFEKEGLDVKLVSFDSGRMALDALLDHQIDIATVAPSPIVAKSFVRDDFQIFSTFVSSDEDMKVMVRKDAGIRRVADLVGKRVGVTKNTTSEFLLFLLMIHAHQSVGRIMVVYATPSDLPKFLQAGKVDAIVTWEPHNYRAKKILGDKIKRLPIPHIYSETLNFVGRKTYLREKSSIIKRFLLAVDQATTFIKKDPVQAQDIAAKKLGLEHNFILEAWREFDFGLSLRESLLLLLDQEARWWLERRQARERKEIPNYFNFIYIDTLKTIKPDVVTIIH